MLWPHLQHFQRNSCKPARERKERHIGNGKHGQVEAIHWFWGENVKQAKAERRAGQISKDACTLAHLNESHHTFCLHSRAKPPAIPCLLHIHHSSLLFLPLGEKFLEPRASMSLQHCYRGALVLDGLFRVWCSHAAQHNLDIISAFGGFGSIDGHVMK